MISPAPRVPAPSVRLTAAPRRPLRSRTQALLALAALSSLLGVAALFALHAGLGAVLAEWRRCGSSPALIALGALAAGPLLAASMSVTATRASAARAAMPARHGECTAACLGRLAWTPYSGCTTLDRDKTHDRSNLYVRRMVCHECST